MKYIITLICCVLLCSCGDTINYYTNTVSTNKTPTANAGVNQTAVATSTIFLDGSASVDPDGNTLSYSWSFKVIPVGSSALLSNGSTALPTFYADIAGIYIVSLVVNDGTISSVPSEITITVNPAGPQSGDIVKTIPFPTGVTYFGDMIYDKNTNSFRALAGTNTSLNTWLQIDADTGSVVSTAQNNQFFINHGSSLTFDGQYIWASGSGYSNAVPQNYVYKVDLNGNVITSFTCPASTTGGFCAGLTWDGVSFWSSGSDTKNIVRFSTSGSVLETYSNLWASVGVDDIAHDALNNNLIVTKDGLVRIYQANNSLYLTSIYVINRQFSLSCWDGHLLWFANNQTQQLEGVYPGF